MTIPALDSLGVTGANALAPVLSFFWELSHILQRSPVPLGVFPLAAAMGYLLYLGVRQVRDWSTRGTPPEPEWKSTHSDPVPAPGSAPSASPPPSVVSVAGGPAVPSGSTGSGSGSPSAKPLRPSELLVWKPSGETTVSPWQPTSVARPPPPPGHFGRNLALSFLAVVLVILAFHFYFFFGLDRVVQLLGRFAFWPFPWPGRILDAGLRHQMADFIFVMYLSLIVGFALTSGVFTSPKFTREQRRNFLALLVAYVLTELVIDIFGFSLSHPFYASAFLVIRGVVGGTFFALMLFASFPYPDPAPIGFGLPRDRVAITLFIFTAVLAVVISGIALYLLFHFVGLGRVRFRFAILLLIPLLTITVWGCLGRILYEIQLLGRPLPSTAEFHPSVTVLIPAYNEEANIRQAVAAADAAASLYPGPVEILVSNDGSTDRTSPRARAAIAGLRHAAGAVVELPHGGKSNALNGGLQVARGDVIVRVDGDARISRTLGFGELVRHFADPEVGAVQGLILPLQQDGWIRKLRFMEIAWNHLFLRRAQMANRAAQVVDGVFSAFRRKDLLAVGGWVSWNGEDTEMTLRLQRVGFRTRFEPGSAAFEDVPETYPKLKSQRIRWTRGGIFAHRRHFGSLFGPAFEFGGIAILYWFAFFLRGGLRNLVWVYAVLVTLLLGLPTLLHVALISLLLLVPRFLILGYYFIHYGRWQWLPYLTIWPVASSIKQYFTIEGFGTMLPGSMREFSE